MVFPLVVYGCDSWTVKKAEQWKTDAFELWCWRRLLRVIWTARRSNQSILKEISPEYALEGLMLKLKLQYFGQRIWRTDSLEKTLMLGKLKAGEKGMTEDEIVGWHHWLDRHEFEQAPGVGDGQGSLVCCGFMGSQRVRHDWATELNWLELRERHGSWMKPVSCNQDEGDPERLFLPRSPTGSCSLSYLVQGAVENLDITNLGLYLPRVHILCCEEIRHIY